MLFAFLFHLLLPVLFNIYYGRNDTYQNRSREEIHINFSQVCCLVYTSRASYGYL